jgi:hypothetical protein
MTEELPTNGKRLRLNRPESTNPWDYIRVYEEVKVETGTQERLVAHFVLIEGGQAMQILIIFSTQADYKEYHLRIYSKIVEWLAWTRHDKWPLKFEPAISLDPLE